MYPSLLSSPEAFTLCIRPPPQKGLRRRQPASDILLTDESSQEMATPRENIIDGKSTVVLEWWGFHRGTWASRHINGGAGEKHAATGKLKVCFVSTVGGGERRGTRLTILAQQTASHSRASTCRRSMPSPYRM